MSDQPNLATLFAQAADLESDSDRSAFLAASCGSDSALRRELEELLAAHLQAGAFMETSAADAVATDFLPNIAERPGAVIGPYKLLEQIGEGGMGLVFMAEQTQPLRRRVAVKIIKPGLDTRSVIARFEAERQALALMDHPNIARVFDAGATDSGRPYFVMELVRGSPVTNYCRDHHLPLRERLELFIEVCHAVQHAHQKGVIHRDLKPTNILVAQSDTAPVPKVIDFGVAKATTHPLTERTLFTSFSQIIGTPLYMSPEQADLGNQDIDTRSDVYSLGVVLYELLTGTTPFDAERLRSVSHDEMRRIIREEEPPKPSTRATTVAAATTAIAPATDRRQLPATAIKGDLDWIVMKALEKDRRRRYESPSAMAEDVRRYLANEIVEARRPSRRYLIQKFAQRHRAALAILVGAAATLVLMSVVGVSLAVRATRAEGLASARLLQVADERNEKEAARVRAVAGERSAQRARRLAEAVRDAADKARVAAEWNLYASRMVQASLSWKDRDYATLLSLISDTQDVVGGSDFRGWEWYFLDRCLREVFLALPPGPVRRLAWHPRRNELAVVVPRSGHRAAIEIWAPARQEPIKTFTVIPGDADGPQFVHAVDHLAWSGDGGRLAYACRASELESGEPADRIVVVDAETGREVFRRPPFDGADWSKRIARSFALSRQGDAIAAGNFHGQVKLWDVKSGTLRSVLYDPREPDNHTWLEFSPDGNRLAGAFRWGVRRVWNLQTGDVFNYEPIGDSSQGVVSWSPDGQRLAATDSNAGAAIYDVDVRAPRAKLELCNLLAICWRDDDNLLVGGMGKWIRTWNVANRSQVELIRVTDQLTNTLELNHDGSLLLTSGVGKEAARIVDLARAATLLDVVKARRDAVGGDHLLQWSRDGRRLASAWLIRMGPDVRDCADLRVIDRATNQVVADREIGVVRDIAWAPKDAALFAFTYHGEFHEIGIDKPASERLVKIDREGNSHRPADFSPDGTEFVYSDGPATVIRDAQSLEIRKKLALEVFTDEPVRTTQWSPDSRRLFIGVYSGWLFADVHTGEMTEVDRDNHMANWIESAAWSPDSKRLAVGVGDGSIELWESEPPKFLTRLSGHDMPPIGIHWSSDGRRLASGAEDGTVRIWDVATGDPVAVFHLPGGVGIFSVQWSPNCRELAAGAANGDVYFFDAGPSFPGPDLPPAPGALELNRDEN